MKTMTKLFTVLIISAMLLSLCACGEKSEPTDEITTSETFATTATTATTAAATTATTTATTAAATVPAPLGDWDMATVRCKTAYDLELRIKQGRDYKIESPEYYCCTVITSDGEKISFEILGLDYTSRFEDMVAFLGHKNPEKLTVGKRTQAIITVYDAEKTEIITKIKDDLCLTLVGPSAETIEKFLSDAMIRYEGEEYVPLDMSDEFETR